MHRHLTSASHLSCHEASPDHDCIEVGAPFGGKRFSAVTVLTASGDMICMPTNYKLTTVLQSHPPSEQPMKKGAATNHDGSRPTDIFSNSY
jgi:hypothetical protein